MRISIPILFFVLGVVADPTHAADGDIRVGGGAGCFTGNIQTAINNADASGVTNIKIARNIAYNAQQLDINGRSVRLIGGFADCNQAQPDSIKTVLNGAGGSANTVVTVRGSTHLVSFANLDIRGGDEVTSSSGFGGGVAIADGPHDIVFFSDTSIHDNRAGYGGGVWIRNEVSNEVADLTVQFGDNVSIDANYGAYGGGGIWCANARVFFTGNNSSITRNSTAGTVGKTIVNGSGGGIRAENCQMWIGANSPLGVLSQNVAGGNGGGLSVSGERAEVRFYSRRADRPSSVLLNTAGGVGGGIDVGSSAKVTGYDLIVANNTARRGGGGVAVFDNDLAPVATLRMQGALEGAPSEPFIAGVAVNCNPSLRCNRIADNQAIDINGMKQPGAAARVATDSGTFGIGSADATLELRGTELSGNTGESVLRVLHPGIFGSANAILNGALIVDNVISGTLLHNPDNGGSLSIAHSTVAGNAIGGAEVIRSFDAFGLRNSIVWQPGKRVLVDIGGSVDQGQVDFVLASDLLGIPPSVHNTVADPQFENSAIGNYRLRVTSPAVDFAPRLADGGILAATADRLPRQVDLNSVPNEFGPFDLGAYERQPGCVDDPLSCIGFMH